MYEEIKPFHKGLGIIKNNTSAFFSLFQRSEGDSYPIHVPVIKRGKGPYLYDYDENRYIDFELSHGSLLLGHAPPVITAVMKSWLSRGYAPGYPVVAHQMLSDKLSAMVLGAEHNKGAWLFYNSSFEAAAAVLSLFKLLGKKGRGIYISPQSSEHRFSPFHSVCIKHLDIQDPACSSLQDVDFAVIKSARDSEAEVDNLIRTISKSGVLIVLDETGFASHVHFRRHRSLLDDAVMRVFGSYLASGLSFGCIYIKKKAFFNKEKAMDYSSFKYIAEVSYSFTLYSIKAIIKYISLLQKQGGISGLLDKSREFYSMLNKEYFELLDGIIYFKVSEKQKKEYGKLRLDLLKSCLYFPLFFEDSINISYAHSDQVLKKSAEKINRLMY